MTKYLTSEIELSIIRQTDRQTDRQSNTVDFCRVIKYKNAGPVGTAFLRTNK